MKMLDANEMHGRLRALEKLLDKDTASVSRLAAAGKLVKGINPKIDREVTRALKLLKRIDQIQKKKVVDLAVEALPGKTEKQKKHKRLILLYLARRKKLKSEIKRVRKELTRIKEAKTSGEQMSAGARLVAYAKGPLGITTLLAGVIAAGLMALESMAVEVEIVNQGCETMSPAVSRRVSLPGVKLPAEAIPSGGKATAVVPPFKATVDGTSGRSVVMSVYGLSFTFNLGGEGIEVFYEGEPVLGQRQVVDLASQDKHQVVIKCS